MLAAPNLLAWLKGSGVLGLTDGIAAATNQWVGEEEMLRCAGISVASCQLDCGVEILWHSLCLDGRGGVEVCCVLGVTGQAVKDSLLALHAPMQLDVAHRLDGLCPGLQVVSVASQCGLILPAGWQVRSGEESPWMPGFSTLWGAVFEAALSDVEIPRSIPNLPCLLTNAGLGISPGPGIPALSAHGNEDSMAALAFLVPASTQQGKLFLVEPTFVQWRFSRTDDVGLDAFPSKTRHDVDRAVVSETTINAAFCHWGVRRPTSLTAALQTSPGASPQSESPSSVRETLLLSDPVPLHATVRACLCCCKLTLA